MAFSALRTKDAHWVRGSYRSRSCAHRRRSFGCAQTLLLAGPVLSTGLPGDPSAPYKFVKVPFATSPAEEGIAGGGARLEHVLGGLVALVCDEDGLLLLVHRVVHLPRQRLRQRRRLVVLVRRLLRIACVPATVGAKLQPDIIHPDVR